MRFLAAALLLVTAFATAQPPAKHTDHDQLRFTLILSRHGIRPPLASVQSLDRYSTSAWPEWEVPLGKLTPHGADALVRMGAYLRLDLVRDGVLPTTGCPAPGSIYLYSDTDERNILSTRNTFAGLAPNCPALPIHTVDPTIVKDPLFSPIPHTFAPPPAAASVAAMRSALGVLDPQNPEAELSPADNPELTEFAHILAPNPAHPPADPILDAKISIATNPSGGDPIVSMHGPLFLASSPVEDLALEFEDNKPMSEVGWGRVDEATLRRLIPLHIKAFALSHRTPFFARAENSNMLAHILDTLEQAFNTNIHPGNSLAGPRKIEDNPSTGAIGPPSTQIVFIDGHDTNLFGVAGVLGMHWTADGRTDDTPPDSQLVFELWQNPKTHATTVRIFYRAQTLDQLRSASPLTLADPPVEVMLTPPGCQAHQPCSFLAFDAAAHKDLDPAFVLPQLLPTQIAK